MLGEAGEYLEINRVIPFLPLSKPHKNDREHAITYLMGV
jgi:hypothetical protein